MAKNEFIERRKEHRLPFNARVIFTDGNQSMSCYASNISRGGVFLTTLESYAIDSKGFLIFFLPDQPMSLCISGKIVHMVFDRQRCEVECGLGFQFMHLTENQRSLLNLHILNQQTAYLELKKILDEERPNPVRMQSLLKKIPSLKERDLLGIRYRVNRICTIFEPAPDIGVSENAAKISA